MSNADMRKNTIQKLASFVRTRESTNSSETTDVNAESTPNIITEERISDIFVAIKVGWYVRRNSLRNIKIALLKLYLRIISLTFSS